MKITQNISSLICIKFSFVILSKTYAGLLWSICTSTSSASLLFLIIFYGLNSVSATSPLSMTTIAAWGIAVVHSTFNIAATVVLLPFAGLLEKLAFLTIPDDTQKRELCLAG